MALSQSHGVAPEVDYVIVTRGDDQDEGHTLKHRARSSATTPLGHVSQHSYTTRQAPRSEDWSYESDSEDEFESFLPKSSPTSTLRPSLLPATTSLGSAAALSTTTRPESPPKHSALADNDPRETNLVPTESGDRSGRVSQTTEHLLIAAGSIGATIIIVMIILALYTMRRRGLTISDVIRNSKDTVRRRGGPPPPPSKYGLDRKQSYHDDYMYIGKDVHHPRPAMKVARSGSLSTQTPLQPLGRSDSFNLSNLDRKDSANRSFLLDDAPSRQNSHHRDNSATPSSPVLPIQDMRRSASTHNTRSLVDDEEQLRYSDPPVQRTLPAPPTFKQFLSNRPSISQRPGFGAAMTSRFSWTNSNAPQTPHDPSRDTVQQSVAGRDSFMTQRSSVPRFRTINSWVNQQSTRVEEQRLKQQFRLTQSSTYSGESEADLDKVPDMPSVPKHLSQSGGLAGKDIKHQRHDTTTSIQTAPIFKAHPGTEVRFSVRSTVPSEVLDMGRKNAAL